MAINLKTLGNTNTETISTFRFRLYCLLLTLNLSLLYKKGGYTISRQNVLELFVPVYTGRPCRSWWRLETAYCSLRNEMERNEMKICSLRNENL